MEVTLSGSPTDTYLSFFLTHPLWDVWTIFLLGMARITPIVAIAPFFGGKGVTDPVKIGFSIALVALFLPFLMASSTTTLILDLSFMLLAIKEVLIGSILGFLIAIPFYYAQGAGALIDEQRGAQSLQVTDPSTQVQTSPIGILYNNVTLVSFFMIGGPALFFGGVLNSYLLIPADQFINPSFFSQSTPLFILATKLCNYVLTLCLQLSAPSIIALLLSDLFLGIVNRMAPQVQIAFLLWSMKAYMGIVVLWLAWWFIFKQIDIQSLNWIDTINKVINTF